VRLTDDGDRDARAREAVRRALKNGPWLFSKEGNRKFFRAHLETEDPRFLVLAAREGDADAIEILRNYARGARRAGMNVPTELHEFVWEYFIDGRPKAKSGTSSKDTDLRYTGIALLVKIVHLEYGFPLITQPQDRDNPDAPMTACRLVGEETGLGERRVEEIWGERGAAVMARRAPG
jgi:hypothetical protein